MKTKTIKCLEEKIWYRLIKVVYIFLFIYCIGTSIAFAINEFESEYMVMSLFAFILFPILIYVSFEIIRRVFYYIVIRTIQPSDDNYFRKLKKHKTIIIGIVIILIIIFSYGLWDINRIDRQRAETEDELNLDLDLDLDLDLNLFESEIKIPKIRRP